MTSETPPVPFGAFRRDAARVVPAEPASGPCMDVALADLDADGDLDVVLSLEGPANVVLANDGEGGFTVVETPTFREPTDSEQAAVADVDGDGCLDVYFANEDIGSVDELYLGDCALGFVDATDALPLKPKQASPANSVVSGDLDHDGFVDLALGHRGQSAWWRGSTDGLVDATEAMPVDELTTQDIALGDLDADGDLDMVLGNEGPNKVWRNDRGTFVDVSSGLTAQDRETRSAAVLDADGDGNLDLLFGNVGWTGRSPQSQLFLGDGELGFTEATNRLPTEDRDTVELLPVDVDMDGDLDVLGANTTHFTGGLLQGPWTAWRNDDGAFTDVTQTWFPGGPVGFGLSVAVGDLDANGLLDAYLCARSSRDRVLFGSP